MVNRGPAAKAEGALGTGVNCEGGISWLQEMQMSGEEIVERCCFISIILWIIGQIKRFVFSISGLT